MSAMKHSTTIITDQVKRNRILIIKTAQVASLVLTLIALIALPIRDWKTGEINVEGQDDVVDIRVFSFIDHNDQEHKYSDLRDLPEPWGEIATFAHILSILLLTLWVLSLVLVLISFICKFFPFRWSFFKLDVFLWVVTNTIFQLYETQQDEVEILQFYPEFNPNPPTHQRPSESPWVFVFRFSVAGMIIASLTNWQMAKLSSPETEKRLSPTDEIVSIKDDQDETQQEEIIGYPFVRDFDLDANTVFMLSFTEDFRRKMKSAGAAWTIRIGCATILVCQWFAIIRTNSKVGNPFDFNGNSDLVEMRLLALIIIYFLLSQELLQVIKRLIMICGIPLKVFRGCGSLYRGVIRFILSGGAFVGTAIIVAYMMNLVPTLLLKISDSEGELGIIGDFTTYVILIEIDNFAVVGAIEFASIFDPDVSLSLMERVREDFFEPLRDQETPTTDISRKVILRYIALPYLCLIPLSSYVFWYWQFIIEATVDLDPELTS